MLVTRYVVHQSMQGYEQGVISLRSRVGSHCDQSLGTSLRIKQVNEQLEGQTS